MRRWFQAEGEEAGSHPANGLRNSRQTIFTGFGQGRLLAIGPAAVVNHAQERNSGSKR